jgi:hypothetical protein
MVKQLALVIILILGIAGTVFVIQKATQLNSKAFSVLDFVYSFHASAGDPQFNPTLDINGDGIINTLDILKDRYAQDATRSGDEQDPDHMDLSNILESPDSAESTNP